MGTSTNGILAYGYDLGGGDAEWKINEVGEYDSFEPDWLDEELGFWESLERRLLVEVAGFTETDWKVDGYFDREKAAKEKVGVELEHYCSDSYTSYVLAAKSLTAYRGDCDVIDWQALEAERVEQGWDDKLATALRALGVTPKQDGPKWLLMSWWSG